jgi:tRNA(Arg) A34 adenosine deaminase TadA
MQPTCSGQARIREYEPEDNIAWRDDLLCPLLGPQARPRVKQDPRAASLDDAIVRRYGHIPARCVKGHPMKPCDGESPADAGRRTFLTHAAAAAATVAAATGAGSVSADATPEADQRKYLAEATRLAIESVEKGWGGPFGAVIVKDGEIIGRGQNRVLLTGCPVFHAEVTAIMDASQRLNPKTLLGSEYGAGTILEMIPREAGSPDRLPQRARMLKGCEIYINAAPCPMCMSAIYWARIDRVTFGTSLEDTSRIGFDDAFQYEDFAKPWSQRRIPVTENFERDVALRANEAWMSKTDRHPY